MRRLARTLLAALAFALVLGLCTAARAEPGDETTISVLTMSPGDPVFFKFGHNGIWVHDARTRRDDVYNWGTFSFDEDGLIWKFFQGRLSYWLSVQSLRGTLAQYESENRYIQVQELDLTPAQKLKLVAALRENARPENRKYRYDYYQDNCSTRVRDMIDMATDGSLRAVSTAPSPLTFRTETMRLTADTLYAYTFLHSAMGSFIDQPITCGRTCSCRGASSRCFARRPTAGPTAASCPWCASIDACSRPTASRRPSGRPTGWADTSSRACSSAPCSDGCRIACWPGPPDQERPSCEGSPSACRSAP
jgi:hypothetical protein